MIHRLFHAVIVASALLVGAGSAWATTIQRYVLQVQPSAERRGAFDVRMELEYRSFTSENKRDGFKFVGEREVRNLRAHTREGEPLTVTARREESSRQWKLEYALSGGSPVNDSEEVRHVVLEFTQDFNERMFWSHAEGELEWAPQFRVEVGETELRALGGFELKGDGCRSEGDAFVCRARGTHRFAFSRPTSIGAPTGFASVVGIAGLSVALLLGLGARRRKLLDEKGVIPPAPAPAYAPPSVSPEVYRAPAPLPKPDELPPPVLPEGEQRQWNAKVLEVLGLSLAPSLVALMMITVFGTRLPIAVSILLALALGATALIKNKDGDFSSAAPLVASVYVIAPLAFGLAGFITGAGIGFAAFVVGLAIKNAGQGGSGGSSSCSSSSCGGGGGGCGGGGGGGGCGG